ncbi:MAG: type II secretion system F family protein [Defluviitaleaceae bacterium]|nr:type II secretion system F family protein [Defluviitaleaceae bacterium]
MPILPKTSFSLSLFTTRAKSIPMRELAIFCRRASFLFGAGLPVKEAMPILAEQSKIENVVSDLHSMVMQGESFSGALRAAQVFPGFMCGYIAIGERTAQLPDVCERLADYYEARAQAEEELAAAMIYPVAVSVMMFGVIMLAITLVLPGYSRIFDASGVALPPFTSALLRFSNFVVANLLALIGFFFTLFLLAAIFFKSAVGLVFSAHVRLKFPIQKKSINCAIVRALHLLLSSGLTVAESVAMCSEVIENPVVQNDLTKISVQVSQGVTFWEALAKLTYINHMLTSLVRIGEDTGNLPETIAQCDAYFQAEYKHAVQRINKLIEPVITVVLGVVLAIIMIAIILPTFELATAV